MKTLLVDFARGLGYKTFCHKGLLFSKFPNNLEKTFNRSTFFSRLPKSHLTDIQLVSMYGPSHVPYVTALHDKKKKNI